MKKIFKIALWAILGLLLIQLIPIDRTNPPVNEKDNFVKVENTPKEVEMLLKKACYDCHSNETKYPSYAYIAPISWSIKHHINEGRKHLNFSVWNTYNEYLKKGALEGSIETIKRHEMPLKGYVAQHPEAQLSQKQRQLLQDYFQKLLDEEVYKK
ncbi:heme-binding domain-containing protein [Riemerella anatipestifer]|uniref:heme-binding domain-containing protein n=1 Tax=Riemerella anatipestifer TaxID=34085 RepID=UPI00069AEEBC|nr:heme-binding domain-containing protein [Riemerella anatipestifer]MDY3352241.1 heme-binding domain-containing protein [Riemerella anatipestifer]